LGVISRENIQKAAGGFVDINRKAINERKNGINPKRQL
jgi:hypothetical protein